MKKSRIKTKLTNSGYIFAALTLAIGVAAVNTGNNLLYIVLSVMLAIMGTSGFLAYVNIKGLEASLLFPDEIYARTPAFVKVQIINKKVVPSFLISCTFTSKNGGAGSCFSFYVPSRKSASQWVSITFPKRGLDEVEFVELSTTFPFGFTIRSIKVFSQQNVLIYPHIRPVRIEGFWAEEIGQIEGKRKEGTDGEFLGIRIYRPGDSPRRIFWKGYAKTRKLLVKQFAEQEGNRILIQLPENPSEEEIEFAASVAVAHLRIGGYVALQVGEKSIPYGSGDEHRRLILKELALI